MQEFEVGNEKFVSLDAGETFNPTTTVVIKSGVVSEFIEGVWVGLQETDAAAGVLEYENIQLRAEEPSVLHLVAEYDLFGKSTYLQRRSTFMRECLRFHTADRQGRRDIIRSNFRNLSISQISKNTNLSYGTIQKIMASNGS